MKRHGKSTEKKGPAGIEKRNAPDAGADIGGGRGRRRMGAEPPRRAAGSCARGGSPAAGGRKCRNSGPGPYHPGGRKLSLAAGRRWILSAGAGECRPAQRRGGGNAGLCRRSDRGQHGGGYRGRNGKSGGFWPGACAGAGGGHLCGWGKAGAAHRQSPVAGGYADLLHAGRRQPYLHRAVCPDRAVFPGCGLSAGFRSAPASGRFAGPH